MRVADHFVAPLAKALIVQPRHAASVTALVTELARYSSATLAEAAAKLRRERSVFPSIAQAVAACNEINPKTHRAVRLVKHGKAWTAWRAHLERQGEGRTAVYMDRCSEFTVDANLLDDLLAIEAAAAGQRPHEPPAWQSATGSTGRCPAEPAMSV